MDIVFVETTEAVRTSDLWRFHQDQLLSILRQAFARASQSGEAVLASFTQPITLHNPLHIFSALKQLQFGELLFWEQPAQQFALIGAGTATTIEAHGSDCFDITVSRWRDLQQKAVIGYLNDSDAEQSGTVGGPILFGGFAFDPLVPRTAMWEDFPDGLLRLPELLFSCQDGRSTLTVNKLVQADDNIEDYATQITSHFQRLHAAIEQIPAENDEVALPAAHYELENLLPPSEWMKKIADVVQLIRAGTYDKVVLARAIRVSNQAPFDIEAILQRLYESYPTATIFAFQHGHRYFAGATPERLVRVQNGKLTTMALAGSYPRGATEEEDRRLGLELLNSEKNNGEHSITAETIRESLTGLCSKVWVADAPRLLRLKNIQHLATAITAELKPGHGILEAVRSLHPTPAVGGFPTDAALAAIREHEGLDRGWYAGPIGWTDLNGNGDFSVALRSALIDNNQATLIAGNGIVAGSEPESELAEVNWKFQVMLRGLSAEGEH